MIERRKTRTKQVGEGRRVEPRVAPILTPMVAPMFALLALCALWITAALDGSGGAGMTASRAVAQGTPSPAVDVEAAVLDSARLRIGGPVSSASVEIDEPARGVVRYRVATTVMAGAVDSIEIRRYPSAEAAGEAVAGLGGGVGSPFRFVPDSGGISTYLSSHFQVKRWFAWASGVRVFKAERQYVSTFCGDAPSPSTYAEILALEAVDHDLIPPYPIPAPTATCTTPLIASVEECATESDTVRVSGTTGEGECTVTVLSGAESVTVIVSDGVFVIDVPLPDVGRVHRLTTTADCGDGCVARADGPGLTTWRLPQPTPSAPVTGTITATPATGTRTFTPVAGTNTVTPTPTQTSTISPSPSASPTSFRVLDLAVSAELANVSPTEKRLSAAVENLGPALAVEWNLVLSVEPSGSAFFLSEPTISGAFVTACRMTEERTLYSCRMGPLAPRMIAEIVAEVGHASHGSPSSQACVRVAFPPAGVTGSDTNPDNDHRCVSLGLSTGVSPTPTDLPTPFARLALPWVQR